MKEIRPVPNTGRAVNAASELAEDFGAVGLTVVYACSSQCPTTPKGGYESRRDGLGLMRPACSAYRTL